jgi:TPR repeat protein
MLGRYLTNGLAGELDPEEGRLWLERAAAQGVPEAESEVAALAGNTVTAADELEKLAQALRRSRKGSEQARPAGERDNR